MFVSSRTALGERELPAESPHFSPSVLFHHKLHHKRLQGVPAAGETRRCEENRSCATRTACPQGEQDPAGLLGRSTRVALGRDDAPGWPPPLLHKDNRRCPWRREHEEGAGAAGAPRAGENNTLQLLREENRALQQLLEQRKAYWAQPDEKTASTEETADPRPTRSPTGCCRTSGPGLLPFEGKASRPAPDDEDLSGP